MLRSILSRVLSPKRETHAAASDREPGVSLSTDRCYVIGDVHGRADLLTRMHAAIDAEREQSNGRPSTEVYLGDLIDRGPDSRAVIESLIERSRHRDIVLIRGNHEDMMLSALRTPHSLKRWKTLGGAETLMSYGVRRDLVLSSARDDLLHADMVRAVPPSHVEFLNSAAPYCEWRNYLFVHAGVRPGIRLDEQKRSDLLLIREPFLSRGPELSFIVVHGHTTSTKPDVRLDIFRIGVDTGAYYSGVLSCLVLEGAEYKLIQVDLAAEVGS